MPIFEPALLTYLTIALIILLGVSLGCIFHLYTKLKNLTAGSRGSFENVIMDVQDKLRDYQSFKSLSSEQHRALMEKTSHIKGCTECYNFKAFDGLGGGKNSFVTAFLDDHGNGLLLSTIDTRDRVNIFAKPIENWQSERTLTEEEQEVLTKLKK